MDRGRGSGRTLSDMIGTIIFPDEETEAQSRDVTCLRPHGYQEEKLGFAFRSSEPVPLCWPCPAMRQETQAGYGDITVYWAKALTSHSGQVGPHTHCFTPFLYPILCSFLFKLTSVLASHVTSLSSACRMKESPGLFFLSCTIKESGHRLFLAPDSLGFYHIQFDLGKHL